MQKISAWVLGFVILVLLPSWSAFALEDDSDCATALEQFNPKIDPALWHRLQMLTFDEETENAVVKVQATLGALNGDELEVLENDLYAINPENIKIKIISMPNKRHQATTVTAAQFRSGIMTLPTREDTEPFTTVIIEAPVQDIFLIAQHNRVGRIYQSLSFRISQWFGF